MPETKLLRWIKNCLDWHRTPKIHPLPSAEFQRTLCDHFCAQDSAAIERAIARHYDGARLRINVDPSAVQSAMSCVWSRTETHGSCFTFSCFQPGHVLNTVVDRWISLFDLFLHLECSGNPSGRVVINFNDAGVEPGLAFCGNSPEHILVPDSDFFKSRGYARAREYFARHSQPWSERSATVFWRGSSLGQKHRPILEMPRARLCQLARINEGFDVGIADVFHVSEADAAQLRAADLIKPRVPWKYLNEYRFHIDIDGHANSYAGLFHKLLSGGLVLKVTSPDRYTQWYYDRLKPWKNFVPIRSDLSDLLEAVAYCRAHGTIAERIAHNGRQLALSLTFENEFATAVKTVQRAFFQSRPSTSIAQ